MATITNTMEYQVAMQNSTAQLNTNNQLQYNQTYSDKVQHG